MHDSADGFVVDIHDLTTGAHGSMTASVANGFGSVHFDPNAASCTVDMHAFHPMYATSSPDTRVPWAAHSYNVAFADETGHFEYCNKVDESDLSCAKPAGYDTHNGTDADDVGCMPITGFKSTLVNVKGCLGTDGDFDGTSYDDARLARIDRERDDRPHAVRDAVDVHEPDVQRRDRTTRESPSRRTCPASRTRTRRSASSGRASATSRPGPGPESRQGLREAAAAVAHVPHLQHRQRWVECATGRKAVRTCRTS